MMKRTVVGILVVLGLAGSTTALSAASATVEKNKYHQVEVTRFEIQEGIKFPPDFLIAMTEELVTQLKDTKKFAQVLHEGETAADGSGPALRMVGTVTEYQAGNRAVRYMVGFGAGKTKIVAHIKFIDRDAGTVLLEQDVDGKVIMGGAILSESIGATRGLAKEAAKVAAKNFF